VSWGDLEGCRLETSDGESLGGWFHRGSPNAPCVIVLHGWSGSRWNSLPSAEFFARQECSVLLLSLRAHGDSSGDVNDFGFSARHDVVAAVEFVERELPGQPIIIEGHSMGAAAAIFAAAEVGDRVAGYILEAPYRDFRRAVRNRTARVLPPLLDSIAFAGLVTVAPLVLPDADRIAPIDYIDDIPAAIPVVFLCGSNDANAQPSEAQELCDHISSHAHVVLFEGAGHGLPINADRGLFAASVLPLLREVNAKATFAVDAEP
jgi:pimeloyl-ACP methyl ester carboxylesterase